MKYQNGESRKLQEISGLVKQNTEFDGLIFKDLLIKRLDEAFMELEGRPLSEKNKEEWFKNFGKVAQHDIYPPKPGYLTFMRTSFYDEIIHLEAKNYSPVYENGLLKTGVSFDYAEWIKKICDSLGVPCLTVYGKGATNHVWNLIYIIDKNIWVNFDMVMARFYLDDWTRAYGEPEKWVMASIEDMFKMQPNRIVEHIVNDKGEVIFDTKVTAENQNELKVFLENLQPFGVSR